ncbi:hypothetical protein WR25_10550 [Diploscapter pachys]|uniref:Uncharacterized protein n=1 Tax=Diploscapter pachys TaxID=2018661 RepID=A0A2A2JT57_9BILA|nr:hypothetical protein WR25_10550 [Diploscapter pachys]
MKISRLRPHTSGPNIILAALLILIEVASSTNPPATLLDEDDTSLHFSNDQNGNAVWVVDDIALPWVGSYEYLSSPKGDKTVLMIVADSSTGKTLAECSLQGHDDDYDHWKRFQWALGPESLQCTVSQTNSSAAIFPKSSVPRSYSIRIQAASGPACMRDLLIQNERPHGCPPRLTRNKFTSNNLLCGCPDGRDHSTEESTDEEPTGMNIFRSPLRGAPAVPSIRVWSYFRRSFVVINWGRKWKIVHRIYRENVFIHDQSLCEPQLQKWRHLRRHSQWNGGF